MHDLTVFFLPVNPLDRRRPTIRLDSPHAGGDGSLTIIIESIEKLRENRASAAATRKIPTTVLRAPRRGATSMSARPPTRTSANGSQCKRQARSAPSPACGGGLGRGSNRMIYHVACPLPVRPPRKRGRGRCGTARRSRTSDGSFAGGPRYAWALRFCRLPTRSSTTLGSASVEVSPRLPYSSSAILRRILRMILPERVFGRPGAN